MSTNKLQSCNPFTNWTARYVADSITLHGGVSRSAQRWMRAFGLAASRVNGYLRLEHGDAEMLSHSLVLDIIELCQSPHARFPLSDPRRALIETWQGLVTVYGTDATPGGRELNRLVLLTDWAEAILSLPRIGFPGVRLMLAQYRLERQRLDLTQLRKGKQDMRHAGALVQLLKLYDSEISPKNRPLPVAGARKVTPQANRIQPKQPAVPATSCFPEHLGIELYGNWQDHWTNTLP